ncbi:MAG: hypothetical protein M1814_003711 [Vezdaea aestivalis]|nr:MAG: hypothetical protein M1814_003711 [Vezdaea aestivalis]
MSNLLILGDADMRNLLHSLSRSDAETLQESLAESLHTYSTGTQEESACSANQPMRSAMQSSPGVSTIFMPARTTSATGIKIVTLSEDRVLSPVTSNESQTNTDQDSSHHASVSSTSGSLSGLTLSSTHSSTGSGSKDGTSTPASTAPSTVSSTSIPGSIFDPMSEKAINSSDPLATPSISPYAPSTRPQGSLTILSPSGTPSAILNATTLTAFRTALATSLLIRKRTNVHTFTVFGAGAQAYWHIRLALLLRSPEIHHVHIIARTFSRASLLIKTLYATSVPSETDVQPTKLTHPDHMPALVKGVKFTILTPEYQDYQRLLREQVRAADVILTCTPSSSPLFPPELLTSTEGRKKGRLVAAIGSYRPHMSELPHEVLLDAVKPPSSGKHHHLHRHAERGGVVVVDTLAGAMKESGEVRKAALTGDQLVEMGELVMLKKACMEDQKAKGGEPGAAPTSSLWRWLTAGNVVYKCVGLGLLDLAVGEKIVDIARERALGTVVSGF